MKKQLPLKSALWALYILILSLSVTQATLTGNPYGVVVVTASTATPMGEEELAKVGTPVHRLWPEVGGGAIDAMLRRLTRAALEPPLTLDTAVVTALNPHNENDEPILMTSSLQKNQKPKISKDYILQTELEFLEKILGTRRNLSTTSDGNMHEGDSGKGIHDLQRENETFTSGRSDGKGNGSSTNKKYLSRIRAHISQIKFTFPSIFTPADNAENKKAPRRPTGVLWGEESDLQCCHSNSSLCNLSWGAVSSQEVQFAMYADWIHTIRGGASPEELALRVACPRRHWRASGWAQERERELLEARKLPMDERQPPLLTAFRTAVARQRPHAGFAAVRILAPLNGEKLRRLVELLDIASRDTWSMKEPDNDWIDDLEGDWSFFEKRLVVVVVAVPADWGTERHGTVALYAGGPGAKKLLEVKNYLKFEDVMRDILGSLHESKDEIDGGGAGRGARGGGGGSAAGVREEELMAVEVPRETAAYRHVKIHVASVRLVPCGDRTCLLPPLRLCLHPTQENCQKPKLNKKGLLRIFPYPKGRTTPMGIKKDYPNRKDNRPLRSLEQHHSSSNTSSKLLEINEQKETSAAWLDQGQDDPETTNPVDVTQRPISLGDTSDDGVNEEGQVDEMEWGD